MTNESTLRGTVIRIPDEQPGLILADGQQIPFHISQVWMSPVAPALNQTVELSRDEGGVVTRICVIAGSQQASEKLRQATDAAVETGRATLDQAKAWVHANPGIAKNRKLLVLVGTAILVMVVFWGIVLTWFIGGDEPSRRQVARAVEAVIENQRERSRNMANSLRGQGGSSVSADIDDMLPTLHSARKIACKKVGDENHIWDCRVAIDISHMGMRNKVEEELRFIKRDKKWQVYGL